MSFARSSRQRLATAAILTVATAMGFGNPADAAQADIGAPPAEPVAKGIYDDVCESGSETEVVVCGRRSGDQYRLPVDMRGATQGYRDVRRVVLDGGLECRNVGPQGCGFKPLPILTIGSDGQLTIGDPDGPGD